MPAPGKPPPRTAPTPVEFQRALEGFWFGTVYCAKQLRRGELWTFQNASGGMLGHLLRMVEWHARSVHGWGYDTWHGGKFIAEWADPRVYAELCETFAHLDVADGWRAMEARIELFHRLAREVAARLGLPYPGELGAHIAGYVDVLRQAEAGHSAPEERVF